MKSDTRTRYLLKRFGITHEQFEELLKKQDNACGVCRRPAKEFKSNLAVDHDHWTGEIRGILCNYCNRRVVGRYRKDFNAALLKAAYEYLTAEYPGWIVPPKTKIKKKRKRNAKPRVRHK